nr:immunoglobulin heavy chain junction region [Mus musculus]NSM08049.1 immunoglobulin heavy chain junction region [Mus musculus]
CATGTYWYFDVW